MQITVYSIDNRPFEWIHYSEPTEAELFSLSEDLGLSQLYIQDVLQAEHLPKVEPIGNENCYFLIARTLDPSLGKREFNGIPEVTRKVAIFLEPSRLVTIQRASSPWLTDLITKAPGFPQNLSAFQVVTKILKETFRSFEPLLLDLGSDLEFFEGKLFENERFPPFAKGLYAIRRKASVLKRLFLVSVPLVEFIEEYGPPDPVAQDALDMYKRIHTLVEEINERAAGLINLNLSISSQRSNEVMRFLTLYSAFFMPLTFLVGIYGMNFRWMPELDWTWGYLACWVLMLGIAGFHWWWFRRKKWL